MEVIQTAIEGVVIIEPRLFNDARGYFFESFLKRDFDRLVRTVHFVQDNESKSSYGVLRGLHFQKPPYAQSKLVRVIKGAVLDVAGYPQRLAHVRPARSRRTDRRKPSAFLYPAVLPTASSVLTPEVIFNINATTFYAPQSEGALAWDDPDLDINLAHSFRQNHPVGKGQASSSPERCRMVV